MTSSLSRYIRPRIRAGILAVARLCFAVTPPRLGFAIVVVANGLHFHGRGILLSAFQEVAARERRRNPQFRLSSPLISRFRLRAARTLMDIRAFDEVIEVAMAANAVTCSMDLSVLLARALFEMARFEEARGILNGWFETTGTQYSDEVPHFKGELALIAGHEEEALINFKSAASRKKHLAWPHQNLAARYSGDYTTNRIDLAAGKLGVLYDCYNYAGQRVIHVGAGHLSIAMYANALRAQKVLRAELPPLSSALQRLLADLAIPPQELRVIPAEWFTQVGHQGLLDILFRMRRLGWWNGRAILLPKPELIANHIMLSLFEGEGPILLSGIDLDRDVAGELLSLQRYCGLSFNAFELPDGRIVPWQDASGLLMQQWEQEGRGVPLRETFDARIGRDGPIKDTVDRIKQQWGMKPEDWYVTLHMRDASHYGEITGFGQSHRNAQVESYLAAIEHITRLGGWVIKLGGPASPRLPPMERVIDYARSPFKSELMDLWLIRYGRFFIGTTSGLANVAISLGVPCALVNCISTDAQPWHSEVRFAVKPVKTADGRELSQQEITSSPWRWRMFSSETLLHHGAIALDNSSDEILETVKEVAATVTGENYATTIPGAGELIESWKRSLSIPYFYGEALPSLYYLRKHESEHFLSITLRSDHAADNENAIAFSKETERHAAEP